MTPAARIETAIDLVGQIDSQVVPAEQVTAPYLRARRFIGSKDRRAISDAVYGVLRARMRLDWWLAQLGLELGGLGLGDGLVYPRRSLIAFLVLVGGKSVAEIAALFDGGKYHPAPLDDEESALVGALAGKTLSDPAQPLWVRGECPEWLLPGFTEVFGGRVEQELAALIGEAPLDLRVNTLKSTRAAAAAALLEEGIHTTPTPHSPLGLRVDGRAAITSTAAYKDGVVEVQDEGSQLIALLSDARPGMAVADFCAGAGGKTLALGAAMGGVAITDQGQLVALDVDRKRLERGAKRLKRAGLDMVERRVLPDRKWMKGQAGVFDRVLVDAPCSGAGAWRRQPDARGRLSPDKLTDYCTSQAQVLETAVGLVKPGGRLIYATCSFLPAENQRPIEAFLAARPDFTLLPAEAVWAEVFGEREADQSELPFGSPFHGPYLLLTTARHGTDGFFAAILERKAAK